MVTEVHPEKFESLAPDEARKNYNNQLRCILREIASINDKEAKPENMEHLLRKKLHERYHFPGRDHTKEPWEDDGMKNINNAAMGKFSGALSA